MKFYLMERMRLVDYLGERAKMREQLQCEIKILQPEEKNYSVQNGNAIIEIKGALQRSPDLWSTIFGSSTYEEIAAQTLRAERDERVNRISYLINSPGGDADGCDSLGQIIRATKKPTASYVDYYATSAAYWLASQTDKIIATSPASFYGSIGVIVAGYDFGGIYEKMGAHKILYASTDAPEKKLSYDFGNDECEKVWTKRLDSLHNTFAGRVAEGRNTTIENVNKNFGRGGVVSAEDALTKGMIDDIATINIFQNTESDVETNIKNQERTVNVSDKIKEQPKQSLEQPHNITSPQIEIKPSYQDGEKEGIEKERKRVSDLMIWREKGEACAAIVDEAIRDGKTYNDVASRLNFAAMTEIRNSADEDSIPALNTNSQAALPGGQSEMEIDARAIAIGKDVAARAIGNRYRNRNFR